MRHIHLPAGGGTTPPCVDPSLAPIFSLQVDKSEKRKTLCADMTPTEFRMIKSPHQFSVALQALWHDSRGDWERAHLLAQEAAGADGDWVHAYLHRKEGDEGNARYWYSRAGQTTPDLSCETEWGEIVIALLRKQPVPAGRT